MPAKGILSCLPIIVLIVLVMMTRRMTESMFIASLLAAILAYGPKFLTGYIAMLYAALGNTSFQLLLLVAGAFGGMISLLEKSGAMFGFRNKMVRFCTGPQKTMATTWALGIIIFIDDYLNALAVSVSMKDLTDHYRIPREHLAYTIGSTGASVCVLIPMSSWAAFAIGSLADYGLTAQTYYRAIPYMFYPFCALALSLLLALRKFPLLGGMKNAYMRVAKCKASEKQADISDSIRGCSKPPNDAAAINMIQDNIPGAAPQEPSSFVSSETAFGAWNFLLPVLCLFGGGLLFDNNIVVGILLALAAMLLLYCGKDKMKVIDFTDCFISGITDMVPLLVTIMMGFAMQDAVARMGFNDFILSLCSRTLRPEILPVAAFILVGLAAFFAASFWMLIIITFPIFIPLAQSMGIDPALVIAAIMSGVAFGSQTCIYSDAMFMVASGTGVSNDGQLRAMAPYIAIGALAASVLFLFAGYLQS